MQSSKVRSTTMCCSTHASLREPIVHICLEAGCEWDLFLCVRCLLQSHRNHKTCSLEQFAADIDNMRFDHTLTKAMAATEKTLKTAYTQSLRGIGELRNRIIDKLDRIQKTAAEHFEYATNSLEAIMGIDTVVLDQLRIDPEDHDSNIQQILRQRQNYNKKKYFQQQILSQFEKIQQTETQTHQILRNHLSHIEFSCDQKSIQKLLGERKDFNIAPLRTPNKFIWGNRLKGEQIQIQGLTITRGDIFRGRQMRRRPGNIPACCLVTTEMCPNTNQTYHWTVQINQIEGAIALGICNKQKAKQRFFSSRSLQGVRKDDDEDEGESSEYCKQYSNILIGSSGYVISPSHRNDVPQSFEFGKGDVIDFQYNTSDNTFRAQKKNETFVVKVSQNQNYSVCAYLTFDGDSVTLIQ